MGVFSLQQKMYRISAVLISTRSKGSKRCCFFYFHKIIINYRTKAPNSCLLHFLSQIQILVFGPIKAALLEIYEKVDGLLLLQTSYLLSFGSTVESSTLSFFLYAVYRHVIFLL